MQERETECGECGERGECSPGFRGMLLFYHSGNAEEDSEECLKRLRGMFSEDSAECSKRFQGMFEEIPGNVRRDSVEFSKRFR